ncbi:MAG: ribulose-phosphate 3-epimerase [Chloroflexi bacterium]|nr:ribulose-phosphate 3-epimerase [Chloroflexota bacterium]
MVKLAPSILSADFARLGEQVIDAERAGADYIHIDVMDGHFVPNITMGPLVVEAVRRVTGLPLDVHLMVEEPAHYLADFVAAGASILTVHVEACPNLHRDMESIHRLGIRAGVAINPGTPAAHINEVLHLADLVLVMTVDPGFGGQPFQGHVLPKLSQIREVVAQRGLAPELSVDGGVNVETAPRAVAAGATMLVAGSAVYNHPKGVATAMAELRQGLKAEA